VSDTDECDYIDFHDQEDDVLLPDSGDDGECPECVCVGGHGQLQWTRRNCYWNDWTSELCADIVGIFELFCD
jgi:hypothetical protein